MRRRLKINVKLILYIIIVLILIGMIIFEIDYSQNTLKKKSVTYSKESEINYVTFLKDNTHYDDNSLNDKYNYVASLIDYFNLDFNYSYVLSEDINYILTYEVIGNLEVYDSDNKNKPIDTKEYKLVNKNTISKKGQLIKVDLFNQKIEYEKYNKIIQEWKKEVSPEAKLKITFNVVWSGQSETLGREIGDNYSSTFEIPISDKIITIEKPAPKIEKNTLYTNQKLGNNFYLLIGSSLFMLLLSAIGLINVIIKINSTKSKYEQKIKKILREFDRAITEAKGKFVRNEGEHCIEVKEFMELMDVHDNINEPIIYYKHGNNMSIFVVRNGKDIYYSVIRREDFE